MSSNTEQNVVIRLGGEQDVEILADFNVSMARETESRELDRELVMAGVRSLVSAPVNGFYVIAEQSGEIVGSLMITTEWSDWRNGLFWWIQSVYVRPALRRQGIYTKLYEHVKTLAAEQGNVCGFRLYVEQHNAVARRAYEALGMEETPYRIYEEVPGG